MSEAADPVPEPEKAGGGGHGRRRLWMVAWLAVGLTLYATWSVLTLREARDHASAGRAALAATDTFSAVELVESEEVLAHVDEADAEFGAAEDLLGSWMLKPIQVLPVAGRQLKSAQSLAATASSVTTAASTTLVVAHDLRRQTADTGEARVRIVERLQREVNAMRATVEASDLGPRDSLIGPLAEARTEMAAELDRVHTELKRADEVLAGLADFTRGPTTYLVFGANNAEMRAGSGSYLSMGLLTVTDGELVLGEFRPTWELLPEREVPIPDQDFEDRWGWISPSLQWLRLNYSPRFDEVSGPLAEAMWAERTGESIDGVLVADPVALEGLLKITGPLEVDGDALSFENVVRYLLVDQYRVPLDETSATAEVVAEADADGDDPEFMPHELTEAQNEFNDGRRDGLSAVARSAVQALTAGSWDPLEILESMEPVAEGRHLMLWGADPLHQRAWSHLGVDGAVPADAVMVSLINWNGSKLDIYQVVESELSFVDGVGSLDISVENTTPDLPPSLDYAYGPFELLENPRGAYGGRLAVSLPGAVTSVRLLGPDQLALCDRSSDVPCSEVLETRCASVPGAAVCTDPSLEVFGPDGDTFAVASRFLLEQGDTARYRVVFEMAEGHDSVTIMPSARSPEITWLLGEEPTVIREPTAYLVGQLGDR